MVVAYVGFALILLALASRVGLLWLYRRVVASPNRDVEPSSIPRTPWLRVQSDWAVLRVLFRTTYAAFPIGTVLVIVDVVLG